MNTYDKRALQEIHEWKNPTQGWFGWAMQSINWPIEKLGDGALKIPGIGWVIKMSVNGIVSLANDFAQWSVRDGAIHEEFRRAGHDEVRSKKDIERLELEDVDRVIGLLSMKYKGLALTEGATAGAMGAIAIPPDVLALITMNLRAIGEYATYCGFDARSQEERLFAMQILGLASSPNDAAKVAAMAQLVKISQDVARNKTWKTLEQHALVKIIQPIAKALGVRLTKAKLAQIIPLTGAVIGGGFNTYYTAKVCDAAYFLYRERFLARKYGEDVIEVTVTPAEDLDVTYPEEAEADRAIELFGDQPEGEGGAGQHDDKPEGEEDDDLDDRRK